MKIIPGIFVALAASLMLPSCFTGVESTPRITAGDVRRSETAPRPEDSYLSGIQGRPFDEWERGKLFRVDDDRIRLLFGTTCPRDEELRGSDISYEGAAESTSFTGDRVTDLTFLSPRGSRMVYRVNSPLKQLVEGGQLSVPFTIEMSLVDEARELLQGKTFYIITRNRRDSLDRLIQGRKFVPVTIDSVTPGTSVNPVKIAFTDDLGRRDWLYLAVGDAQGSPRTFASQLAFDNPRKDYPAVTDEHWTLIVEGKVTRGMTRDECRLSLGKPASVDRAPGVSYLHERWGYENGIYLIFEDGILTAFRR